MNKKCLLIVFLIAGCCKADDPKPYLATDWGFPGTSSCTDFNYTVGKLNGRSDKGLGKEYGYSSGDSRLAQPDATYFHDSDKPGSGTPSGIYPLHSYPGLNQPSLKLYNEDINNDYREEHKAGNTNPAKRGWPTYNSCTGQKLMFQWIDPVSLSQQANPISINVTNISQKDTIYAALYYVLTDDENKPLMNAGFQPDTDYPGLLIRVDLDYANPDPTTSVFPVSALGGALLGEKDRMVQLNFTPLQKMGACRLWLMNHAGLGTRGKQKDARCCDCKWADLVVIFSKDKNKLTQYLKKYDAVSNSNDYKFQVVAKHKDDGTYDTSKSPTNIKVGIDETGAFTISAMR